MKAAVWHGAKDVRIENVPEPGAPGPEEVLVEVDVACICASDVAEYLDGPHVIPVGRPHSLTGQSAPITLGHEFVGRVVETGPGVTVPSPGDRVCGDACIRCGECFWCLRGEYNICVRGGSIGLHMNGAFAPLLKVPAYTLFRVPDEVDDRSASIVEPVAVGLHALTRARFRPGETVIVVGFGMIGAAATLVATAVGAGRVVVVEPAWERRDLAQRLGADDVFEPGNALRSAIQSRIEGVGADVVIDCTGNPAILSTAVELSRRGGRVVVCGLAHSASELRTDRLVYFEREILGSLGYRYDHESVLRLMARGRLGVTDLFAPTIELDDLVSAGLETMDQNRGSAWLRIPVALRSG